MTTSILNGRYQLRELLGEGGMAVVYTATQLNLEREVAVKFIKGHSYDQNFTARFQREAKAIAQLNHPNITQVYDFDIAEDGRHYMVMERLHGMDLAQFLKRYHPLQLSDMLTIMRGVAAALSYAHSRSIVHRDVKPSNIFITPQKRIKLMDFGLAKLTTDGSITQSGASIGTPRYFSPEQATGAAVDHRTDIYSLGVVFYEIATGQLPFQGDNLVNLALQHMTAPVRDPRELRPDLPPLVTTLVFRMLAKDPEARYPTVDALLEDLATLGLEARTTGVLPKVDLNDTLEDALSATTPDGDAALTQTQGAASSRLLQRSVRLPVPLIVLLLVGLLGLTALAAALLTRSDDETATPGPAPLALAPARSGEYLILVADWGDPDGTLDRRVADTIRASDAIGISPHLQIRIEPIERRIHDAPEAAALAHQWALT
ncbi:MAG: serine/threonine protein kinase [Anaerolineae bacterium]|nr:serine/threonine protein kinase [Anaerolineae bacterium]